MQKKRQSLQIYYWDYFIILKGNLGKVPLHSHNALQVFIDQKKKQIVKIKDRLEQSDFIIVKRNTEHEVVHSSPEQISILIDGDSQISEHFSHLAGNQEMAEIRYKLLELFIEEDFSVIRKKLTSLWENNGCANCHPKDPRILRIKEIIDQDREKKIPLKKLAELVHLSESRLAHLFKKEMGIPLRKYLLWKRLFSALHMIKNGNNLTNAAYSAGFADSAHLSRTFTTNFGINLSRIFKNSRFIQFFSL